MKEKPRFLRSLEHFFWVFLFINPFLDILNGVYLNLIQRVGVLDVENAVIGITPTLVLRMLLLVVFAVYVLCCRDRRDVLTAAGIAAALVLSMISEYRFTGKLGYFVDLQYMARFAFNIVLFMVYSRVLAGRGWSREELLARLDRLIRYTLFVLTVSILVSSVLGLGYSTYADRLGYRGSRGFFYAGNDITAILVLLLPAAMAGYMQRYRQLRGVWTHIRYIAPVATTVNALMMIGSKTAFLSLAACAAVLLVCAVCLLRRQGSGPLLGFAWCVLASLVLFGLLFLLSSANLLSQIADSFLATSDLAENEGVGSALFSGRQVKLAKQLAEFKSGGVLVWLFGMGRGSQEFIVEMDVCEVLLYYGVFGLVTMLWLYLRVGIAFVRDAFRKFDLLPAALLLSVGLVTGYMILAGHILFSVTSGFYYVFMFLYGRAVFSDDPKGILLWKG